MVGVVKSCSSCEQGEATFELRAGGSNFRAASRGKQLSMASKTTEITATKLESVNKRDLERLCRRHSLRPYGLKSQLLARLCAHRATLSSDSTAPPASSASIEPGLPAAVALSPYPPLLPAATSTPLAPHRSAGAAAFSPEQQAYTERLIASRIVSAEADGEPSTSLP